MRRLLPLAVVLLAFCHFPAVAAGTSGQALQLGRGGRLMAPLPTTATKNVTIELWVRTTMDSSVASLAYIGDGFSKGYGILMHNGHAYVPGDNVSLHLGGATLTATGTAGLLRRGEWTHLAITRGESDWTFYRNGAVVGRSKVEPITPEGFFLIGPSFDGEVDEVRVWTKERTRAQILQTMGRAMTGSEPGLTLYYNMDGETGAVAQNRATATGATLDGALTGEASFVESNIPFTSTRPPVVELTSFPAHMQFFPRAADGFGTVTATGRVTTPGFDSIAIETFREGSASDYQTMPLSYSASGAPFTLTTKIRAELAEHAVRLIVIKGSERVFVAEGGNLVAGDVYLVAGQSNAHTTNDVVLLRNRFLRTFGVQTPAENMAPYNGADTMWGLSNAHGFGARASGSLLAGVWGLYLQQILTASRQMPICVINGGAGGSTLAENLRTGNRYDSSTVYGRMLYRAERAGLREAAKAIIWHHGESHTIDGYAEGFSTLRSQWKEDYPGLQKIYVLQIRPGCVVTKNHGALREFQRTLGDVYPDVEVMSTTALLGHEFDNCHFSPEGYFQLAERLAGLIERDIYNTTATGNIEAPNLDRAFYTSPTHDEIALVFRGQGNGMVWPGNVMIADTSRPMVDAFFLDGVSGHVSSGRASGDTVFLTLHMPSTAMKISYGPDLPWYPGSNIVYEGPWLVDSRGVGAFLFFEQPIGERSTVSVEDPAGRDGALALQVLPNPASTSAIVRFNPDGSGAPVDISILSLAGEILSRRMVAGIHRVELDLTSLPSGVYICRVGNAHRLFSIVR